MATDTILVVDGSAEARAWLIDNARSSGDYAWLEAGNLAEAQAHLKAQRPRLLIVDAQLGDEDALRLLAESALPADLDGGAQCLEFVRGDGEANLGELLTEIACCPMKTGW